MRITNKFLAYLILTIGFSGYATAKERDAKSPENCSIAKLDWLLGSWVDHKQKAKEVWQRVSEKTLEGKGYTNKSGAKTLPQWQVYESLRIVEMNDDVFFIAKVAHNDLPVAFAATHCQHDQITFENKAHDFPNKINYQRLQPKQLMVTVSGNDGKGFELMFAEKNKPVVTDVKVVKQ